MKNSPSVLSCIVKRTKEGCDRGSEVETPTSRRLNKVVRSRPPIREMGRNGKTTRP